MNDEVCSVLRDIIHDAIDEAFCVDDSCLVEASGSESMSIEFTDIGLAVTIGDKLYAVVIERV